KSGTTRSAYSNSAGLRNRQRTPSVTPSAGRTPGPGSSPIARPTEDESSLDLTCSRCATSFIETFTREDGPQLRCPRWACGAWRGRSRRAPRIVQATMGPHVHREEIRRRQELPLRFEELGSRRFLEPVWRGLEAVFAKDIGDRPSRHLVMEV